MKVSLVIPVFNEENTIGKVIDLSKEFVDEIIIVDDCSSDKSVDICHAKNVKIICNNENLGYARSIQKGLDSASNELIITMDADLEHDPSDIKGFLDLYDRTKADLIIGKRKNIPRKMERVISFYTKEYYGFDDALVGMRLINNKIIDKLIPFSTNDDYGLSFVIDAAKKGLKIINYDLSREDRRENPRVGNEDFIDKKLKKIFVRILES